MKLLKTGAIALAVVLAVYFGYRHFLINRRSRTPGRQARTSSASATASPMAPAHHREWITPPSSPVSIGRPVINAGIPGDTTATALSRLDRDVLGRSPRIVLITLGGNDLKNRQDRDRAFRNLKTIITSIQDRGALVIWWEGSTSPSGGEVSRNATERFAKRRGPCWCLIS